MITSRGCPYRCSFCASHLTMGRRFRPHSPEYVLEELKLLVRNYGTEQVIFQDDTFTVDRERVRRICELMLREGLRVEWFCFSSVNTADRELLSLMRRAGCFSIGYGVESGLLDEKEAMYHEERHIVSNVIGSPDMRIEIGSTLELAARDTLLVASDGLWDNLHTEEIVDKIRKGGMRRAVKSVATECGWRMVNGAEGTPSKPDDLTFILFRLYSPRRKVGR